jgi:hypothetical protein
LQELLKEENCTNCGILLIAIFFPFSLQVQYLSFDAQIDAFENVKEGIKAKIGDAAAEKLSNEALYLIGLGIQNLFLDLFFIYLFVRKKK